MGLPRYQVGLTFAFNETEVLGDAPDTNSIIVRLVEEEAEVRKGERTYPSSPGDSTGCLARHLPGSSPFPVLKCDQLARVSAPRLLLGAPASTKGNLRVRPQVLCSEHLRSISPALMTQNLSKPGYCRASPTCPSLALLLVGVSTFTVQLKAFSASTPLQGSTSLAHCRAPWAGFRVALRAVQTPLSCQLPSQPGLGPLSMSTAPDQGSLA